jgi:hypothetical protein
MDKPIRSARDLPPGADQRHRLIQPAKLNGKRLKGGFRAAIHGVQARQGKEDSQRTFRLGLHHRSDYPRLG